MIRYRLFLKGSEKELNKKVNTFCKKTGFLIKKSRRAIYSFTPEELNFLKAIFKEYAKFKLEKQNIHDITGEVQMLKDVLPETIEYLIGVKNFLQTKFVFILVRVKENEWFGCYTTHPHKKVEYYLNVLKELGLLYDVKTITTPIKDKNKF